MALSKEQIAIWFDSGLKDGATHMLVVCDIWDYDHYPVYVMKDEDVRAKYDEYNSKQMQRVEEIYDLKIDKEGQVNTSFGVRTFNMD